MVALDKSIDHVSAIAQDPQKSKKIEVAEERGFLAKYGWVLCIVCGHTICAGGLTVVNKWALNHYHSAFTLTFVQLAFSAVFIQICGWVGLIPLQGLKWKKMFEYAPAAAMFYITVVASNKVIQLSSVNTFVVVRCMVPVVVAFLEKFVLPDQSTLGLWSVIALLMMAAGGFLYVQASTGVVMSGLEWIIMYFVTMPIDALLIKRALNNIKLPPWDLALYNNSIAACCMPLGATLACQWEVFHAQTYAGLFYEDAWLPILVSCIAAVGISFFQMNARNVLTATAFMVLGVMNKLLTIMLDKFLLHSKAPKQALVGVVLAIAAGIFWQMSVAGG